MTTNLNNLPKIDEEVLGEVIEGIQKISRTGVTQLPSRDIPSTHNSQDAEIIPNYVPKTNEEGEEEGVEEEIQIPRDPTSYNVYDEMQMPLFVAVTYFLFQLPSTKKYVLYFFPSLFLEDDNYNLNGYIFMSILYTICFFIISKFLGSN